MGLRRRAPPEGWGKRAQNSLVQREPGQSPKPRCGPVRALPAHVHFPPEGHLSANNGKAQAPLAQPAAASQYKKNKKCGSCQYVTRLTRRVKSKKPSKPTTAWQRPTTGWAGHLEANGVDLAKDNVQLGMPLKFDPHKERLVDNARWGVMGPAPGDRAGSADETW
jgi:hypothetical protein